MRPPYRAVDIMRMAGIEPDLWQAEVLYSTSRVRLRNCARQVGKTTVAAAAAVQGALSGLEVKVVSPTAAQAREMLHVITKFAKLPQVGPVASFDGGMLIGKGCVVVVPGYDGPCRIPEMLIIDDAAYVDELPDKKDGSRFLALSTPRGRSGPYFDVCRGAVIDGYDYREVPAGMCPRISQDHLNAERETLGKARFGQEYLCKFVAA